MDEVSNGGTTLVYNGNTSIQYQINPNCLRCQNYGNSDYDIRNYFSASYVWQTPFKFSNKFVNGAFGGWTLSQNFFARTGLPYTILDGFDALGNYGPAIPVAQINTLRQQRLQQWTQPVRTVQASCLAATLNPIYSIPGYTGVPLASFPNQRRNTVPRSWLLRLRLHHQQELQADGADGVRNRRQLLQHLQPSELRQPGQHRLATRTFGQITEHDGTADRAVRIVLRRSAFGTHHPVPGQVGVLIESELLRLGGSFGSRRFLLQSSASP